MQRNRKVNLIEQNKWTENIPKEVQSLDLLSRDFKTTIISVLKELKKILNK